MINKLFMILRAQSVQTYSRELPVDIEEKRSKIVIICFAKSYIESLEASEFHEITALT